NHPAIEKELRRHIEFAAAEGLPNVICMSGNRQGMPDDQGIKNCAIGLKRILSLAEKKRITVCMEGLNSKVDHADYMYDKRPGGVEFGKQGGQARCKLLYDIYKMQMREGAVIRKIKKSAGYLAHYPPGGTPGRHEIGDPQEQTSPAIVKAILETGY